MITTTVVREDRVQLEAGFIALYQADGAAVLRYLRAVTGSENDAEDLCAETFRRAWQAWARFKPGSYLPVTVLVV